jgi:hypothetical protein
MDITKNTGFLEAEPRQTDWIAGAESGIKLESMNHFGDWTVFLPTHERQNSVYMDSMACVTFSALNSLESQLRAHIGYQRLPVKTIKALKDRGYFNEHLEFNLSDRFTAKMSGTTRKGNYFTNVWDSIRKHGALPEADWPYKQDFNWDNYYSEIPQALKTKALDFLNFFEVKYEWIPVITSLLTDNLFQAPIQIATPLCNGWSTDKPVKACTLSPNHATMLYRIGKSIFDFDHYAPFRKELALDYPISYAIKGVLYLKPL